MTPEEIEAALQAAFEQCDRADVTLNPQQQQILRRALVGNGRSRNPLADLTLDERRILLKFVQEQEQQNRSWKMVLLNDWLQGEKSGKIQFVRDRYGMQWLEQIQPIHLADYDDLETGELQLKLGDRIEVTNGLWEWVQESDPHSREWFTCTVIGVHEPTPDQADGVRRHASCVIRFESGAEYEIQGIYEWNRPNWRWLQD